MTTRRIAVISAGLSQPSSTRLLADRLAQATSDALSTLGGAEQETRIDVIELRDLAHQITDNMLTGFPPPELATAIETMLAADGVIAVSPIFSASYSGLFKSFFDIIDVEALIDKPVLLGATGGTARHSLALEHALRPLFSYLRTSVSPTAVFAASADWGATGGVDQGLSGRILRAGSEFAAIIATRAPSAPAAELFADFIPFEEQLAGHE